MPNDKSVEFNVVNRYMLIADPEPDPFEVLRIAEEEGLHFALAYKATHAGNVDRAKKKLLDALKEGVDQRVILHDLLVLLCR